jgi:hypothetical protein
MGRVVQIQKARIKLAMRDFKRLHGILVIMTLHEGFDKQLYKNAERANRLISFIILAAKTHLLLQALHCNSSSSFCR